MLRKRDFIFISLFAVILGLTIFSSNASAASLQVDNDCLSTAPGDNYISGSWSYRTVSGLNGDYRITSSSNFGYLSGTGYGWIFNATNKNAAHYVYLANSAFTNPKTAYQIDYSSSLVYVNQNTAPSGWNYLKTNNSSYDNAAIYINGAMSSTTGSVGADGAKITY